MEIFKRLKKVKCPWCDDNGINAHTGKKCGICNGKGTFKLDPKKKDPRDYWT